MAPGALIKLIQQGGYVIYFRHAATDHDQFDLDRSMLDDCSTQRNLDALGRRQAEAIGEGFKRLRIPVGKILASPWCRAKDTAMMAFGRVETTEDLSFSISKGKQETDRLAHALRKMLRETPSPRSNTVLIAHTSNLKEATGIWPKPEGAMAVFKPDPDADTGYEYLGMLGPGYWLGGIAGE
ncbi:hypothetical protein Tel_14825 [Candidatus Tenderia electrophaga]|jgi:phosphohistidine phosphatase SixA|uniref:Phosphoglycerate mutase n=1 Tax=Candidatus Tenderia electrophaga TaxID=1748243 RepID=A0A0S2TGP2_9GAMM|nr:hypothetical protein Tel_14825 [Candidatus Tenderia electrophaga]